jgi:POT family proton-dependent oligopeptide transporter
MGHPKALWQLSNIEMWERFSYYGMRALLAVYVATTFFGHLGDQANAQASLVYGGYTALVYATGIIGGYIADHVLGYQRSILLGAIIMAAGLFVLLIEDLQWFLVGLALIVAGNGLFKPNISTMIGKLYAPGDVRRDSGFTIFYMGINLGAFIAPFITAAWIGATWGLKWGFFAAAIGMVLSTLFLEVAKKSLGHVGLPPKGKDSWGLFFLVGLGALAMAVGVYFLLSESEILGYLLVGIMLALMTYFIVSGIKSGDRVQLQRYIAMLILFVANACFWALFEQAGSSMNFFAREFVTPMFGSMETWQAGGFGIFQSLNPLYILLFAPLFAAIWPWLDKRNMNPSIPRKLTSAT